MKNSKVEALTWQRYIHLWCRAYRLLVLGTGNTFRLLMEFGRDSFRTAVASDRGNCSYTD
jgi:hypothetical protein